MRLTKIHLENYRNYDALDIEFNLDRNVHLFIGDNAQGKTNFLESITLLSLAKSFRQTKYVPLIKWGADFTRVVGEVKSGNNDMTLEFFASVAPVQKKNLRKDGTDVNVKDFIGEVNTVLFHPEDLNMLYLSPSLRRRFLDTLLSQTDPLYFDSLVQYNRVIKQRNKALFLISIEKNTLKDLEVWDEQLAEYGAYILKKRLDLVEFFNNLLEENYRKISNTEDKIEVKYSSSLNEATDKKTYLDVLKKHRDSDIKYGQTTKGVHRDDVEFYFNGHDMSQFGSRGEIRTLLIALKLCEIAYIENQRGHKPILLLDDVFSELDKKRQEFLMKSIQDFQSFITTTHHDFYVEEASVLKVSNGMLN